jgi:AcrR family transcriptional regulator
MDERRNGPGRPRSDTLGRRRRQLLETARGLFLARGYGAVPLADIARSAGVAMRTIYLQYGSKEGLLRGLIEDEDERHRAELARLDLDGKPWHEQLAGLALHVATRSCRPGLMRLREIVIGYGDPALIDAFERAGPGRVREALAPVLADAAGAGPLHGLHSHAQVCDHFIACIAGLRPGHAPGSEPAQARARRGLDLFMRVLSPAQVPEKRFALPLLRNASTM